MYRNGQKQQAYSVAQELQQHIRRNPFWQLCCFDIYQCTPFGAGHSQDLSMMQYHLNWQTRQFNKAQLRHFNQLVLQYSNFPGLVKFNEHKRPISELLQKNRLQARELHSVRYVCDSTPFMLITYHVQVHNTPSHGISSWS